MKSKKAQEYLDRGALKADLNGHMTKTSVYYKAAITAVELAETEARERVIVAFRSFLSANNFYNADGKAAWEVEEDFILKLDEL